MRIFIISFLLAALVLTAAVHSSIGRTGRSFDNLDDVHRWVAAEFPAVAHIQAADLAKLTDPAKSNSDTIIFDVRQPDEFTVSHIPGAVQVTPGIDESEFIRRFGTQLKGKTAVFYCSVGYRSSRLAEKLDAAIRRQGTTATYNLAAGLFGWHNEKKILVSMAGRATRAIHPYDQQWGRLLEDRGAIALKPAAEE